MLPSYFLVSMYDNVDSHLLVFWLHFLSTYTNDRSDYCGDSAWWIEHNRDPKFYLQSCKSDDQDRNNGHMVEPGRGCASDRFRLKYSGCVLFRLACTWCIFSVHVHPTRDVYLPLHLSSHDERHNHCSIVDTIFLFNSRFSFAFPLSWYKKKIERALAMIIFL